MTEPIPMSDEMIAAVLDEVRCRIVRLETQAEEIQLVLAAAREEEQLLLKLLALRREPRQALNSQTTEKHAIDKADVKAQPVSVTTTIRQPAMEAVARELAVAGRPIHISELMRLLEEKKVKVPGAGTQANLIAHLRRDARFVRPSRGMYGLAAWGLENMPVPAKRKKRRRRATSPINSERKK